MQEKIDPVSLESFKTNGKRRPPHKKSVISVISLDIFIMLWAWSHLVFPYLVLGRKVVAVAMNSSCNYHCG
jgi:hypothetical protein